MHLLYGSRLVNSCWVVSSMSEIWPSASVSHSCMAFPVFFLVSLIVDTSDATVWSVLLILLTSAKRFSKLACYSCCSFGLASPDSLAVVFTLVFLFWKWVIDSQALPQNRKLLQQSGELYWLHNSNPAKHASNYVLRPYLYCCWNLVLFWTLFVAFWWWFLVLDLYCNVLLSCGCFWGC